MTGLHHCQTGWHRTPSRSCYIGHGCRCDGCRWHEATYYAQRNGLPAPDRPDRHVTVDIPLELWSAIRDRLETRGVTFGDALRQIATGEATVDG